MTAKIYNLSKDILKIIDEYLIDEINYQDLLKWAREHPCLKNSYCSDTENRMINDFYRVIKINDKNISLVQYRDKIMLKYLKEKYTEST